MDVFGTIVSTIELVGKLVGYLQAVKGAKDDRQKLLLEVSALGTLLDVLRGRLRPSADDNSDSISDMLVKAGIEHPLRMCLEALGPIVRKLESPIPDANVGTSHPTKISEKIRDLKWPFQKTDIKEALNSIERLKTLILLAFQTSLMAFVEKVHEELVTMGLDVKEIKSAVSRLEEGQRAYMKEIEDGKCRCRPRDGGTG
ncbi:hypothetical protein BD779DRAFT_1705938 [Infundibulicybe gibba]|nr:hypothetical protein BD779DRAFT_1705938 [Infundibulicybe gibba]